jgi:hypothetical protein
VSKRIAEKTEAERLAWVKQNAAKMSMPKLIRACDSASDSISEMSRRVYKNNDEYNYMLSVQGIFADEISVREEVRCKRNPAAYYSSLSK